MGAFISTAIGRAAATVTAVSKTPSTPNTSTLVPMTHAAPSRSPSPIRMPSSTVDPIDSPATMPVTMSMVWLPVETAETSAEPQKRPTAHRSNAP